MEGSRGWAGSWKQDSVEVGEQHASVGSGAFWQASASHALSGCSSPSQRGQRHHHLKDLNDSLAPLDLEVKRIEEPALAEGADPPIRYLTVLKGTMTPTDARMAGWRIDHLAGLAVALGFIMAKQGRAPRDEVEDLLASKIGRWRASTALDGYVRSGYLREDDDGLLAPDWRTTAEVDVRQLMGRLLAMKPEEAGADEDEADEDDEDLGDE